MTPDHNNLSDAYHCNAGFFGALLETRNLVEAEIPVDVAGHLLDHLSVMHVLVQAGQFAKDRSDEIRLPALTTDAKSMVPVSPMPDYREFR
ncbi:hypothetical protein V2A29_24920 [Pseudomonas aeruginosa]|nr:hypothetical protein [Pseudomonas aeruginosa]EKX0442314.1 hypothetical protein [Pseudomonas aeruginosa]ELN2603829.1 hypothetical protein [Pseudomonas aeruginosa]ELN4233031.1 hypothetical protein [Pseudomonas aeruginosa]ELN4343389.1 hypothetical protein [Pseudomonas aeruginosa]ELO0664073.1 hypothetical protein [Pseudomonas aeruginosa]